MAWKDRLSGIIIALFSAAVVYLSLRVPMGRVSKPGPGVFPLLMGFLIGLLALFLIAKSSSGKKQLNLATQERPANRWPVYYLLGDLCLYAFLFRPFGFIVSTFVFLVALKPLLTQKWIPVLLGSLFVSLALFFFFNSLLKVELPMGILAK